MSKKEVNAKAKNNEVAETKMSNGQMEQFVKDNTAIVPKNQRKKFEALTLEQKVSKIHHYLDSQKTKGERVEKNKLENKVKELFDRRKVTTEDVLRVIEFCKKYIESTKAAEIEKLQTEIERLSSLKRTLESN